MAAERLSMRKLRELFRLRFEAKLTTRSIATSLGIGNGTVCDYLGRARVAKRTWPLTPELDDDAALTALLFPEDAKALAERPEPDWARVHAELKKKGVTTLLLWQEYLEAVPGGYQYSRFCERYGRWRATSSVTLRQEHRAGEECFVDFSGDGVQVVDAATSEVRVTKLLLRGGAGRQQPDVRGARLQRGRAYVGGLPRAGLRLLRRRHRGGGARQPQGRRHPGTPVCAGLEPHVSGPGAALRLRDSARTPSAAPGQGQGGGGRAADGAVDSGGAAPPALHVAGPGAGGGEATAGEAQRAAHSQAQVDRRLSSTGLNVWYLSILWGPTCWGRAPGQGVAGRDGRRG